MPWRYWLKWLLAVDTRLRIILAQKAHQGPINDCATLRPLLDEVVPSTPLEPLWPMPSSTASATTGTSVNRLARRASFRLNEASRAGSFTECVRKCGRPSPPSFIVNASMLRPSSAQSNANSQPKHRAVRSPRNANKRFYWAWPTTSISSGHFILDFHFMPEAFQQSQRDSESEQIASARRFSLVQRDYLVVSQWLSERRLDCLRHISVCAPQK